MHDIKQLYDRLDIAADDEERLHIYFDIATVFLNRDEKRVLEYAQKLNETAERIDSNLGRCFYHATMGRVLYRKALYAEAEAEFQKALDLSLLTTDLLMQAISYDSMGVVYVPQHKHEQALQSAFKALAVYEQMDTEAAQWQKVVCYNNIGVAYKNMHQLDLAEANFLKGLALAEHEPDDRMKCNLLSNICEIKILQGKYDEGIACVLPSIEGFKKLNHKVGEVHAIVYAGHCYLGKGEFAVALQYYIDALKKLKDLDHKTIETQAQRGLGDVYVAMQAFAEAIQHYQKALQLATAIPDYKEMCNVYLCLGKAHQSLGQLAKSEVAYNQGLELAQSKGFGHLTAKLEASMGVMGEETV